MLFSAVVLASCASAPKNDPEAMAEFQKLNDPVESINRGIFGFNQILDKIVIKPVTAIYRAIAPAPIRKMIGNFLNNLKTPVILANDILQGEGKRAGDTVVRFVVNSTLGLLGFLDPAEDFGFARHEEDFGQTLAVWGAEEGPYLMLPVLGPSNPRDLIGKVVDFFIDPINWWSVTDDNEIAIIRTGVGGVGARDNYWDALEDIEKNSIDPYASYRSLYRQRRSDDIRNGAAPTKSQLKPELELAKD